ncbi:prolyl-tRNA synthetase [Bellilinea caldifistulae]|uniref:proline--tRNA ligase n=1 Tax=Bellilinea caldifistulae TaxID=360411 RepID=UPI0007812E0D|nr:proline--tRNA ligase [Bellilinea caldifistulae]GAP11558.1 prolyl-tRNA synthetase [Bellilinea caldifistulae]
MRLSELFSQTLRESPAEAQSPGYACLLRAGYFRQVAAGIFAALPLGLRVQRKIERILREEMQSIGGQEVSLPVVLPAEIWKESGRWYRIGAEMARFKDRAERDLVLAMTHEESVADLVRREIRSHRQLPRLIYQIQTKFRDDPRPRAGLIRVREFIMKDSYSLDADWAGLEKQYQAHYEAYLRIFRRVGLPVIAVASDSGMMGGKRSHEFMYLNPIGEDTLMLCDACGYAANRQVARFAKPQPPQEEALPVEKVHTPHTRTIESLARFLGIPESRTAKAVFLTATLVENKQSQERLVMVIVRGDMELNETKLANLIGAVDLRPATEEEIRTSGAVPGFASPVGLHDLLVVVDDLIPHSPNLVAGANEEDYHLRNVNFGRDYTTPLVADLTAAREGDPCPHCQAPLRAERGIEVGNIFQLGTAYSEAMGCTFQDEDGQVKPVVMGSYGIGVGRLIGCLAEAYHDEKGLKLPAVVAPYQVHLVLLSGKDGEAARQTAERLYEQMQAAGLEVLYDDREESPGVKFNDADLIGIPLRVTVSKRTLENGTVEIKPRGEEEKVTLPLENGLAYLQEQLARQKEQFNF